jgi:hypothetical protein
MSLALEVQVGGIPGHPGAGFDTDPLVPPIHRAGRPGPSPLALDRGIIHHLRVFDALGFGIEIVGGSQPAVPNDRVSGFFGELAVPARQLPQPPRIRHSCVSFAYQEGKLGQRARRKIDRDQFAHTGMPEFGENGAAAARGEATRAGGMAAAT